eukprot:9345446-Pyramimonas_sp.AAC.2
MPVPCMSRDCPLTELAGPPVVADLDEHAGPVHPLLARQSGSHEAALRVLPLPRAKTVVAHRQELPVTHHDLNHSHGSEAQSQFRSTVAAQSQHVQPQYSRSAVAAQSGPSATSERRGCPPHHGGIEAHVPLCGKEAYRGA